MTRKWMITALTTIPLITGCVPDETHQAALMRASQLENQLSTVQSLLSIVEITLVILGALLALCLVAVRRLGKKGGRN